jgi:hypothetical protein
MGKKLRKFNRATHRDLGYFFVAMILIYSISGIAINHLDDWNPSYNIKTWTNTLAQKETKESLNKAKVKAILKDLGVKNRYRKHYFPNPNTCKVIVKNGSLQINISNNTVDVELIQRKPILHTVNWLHYNPNVYWKWFSDIFAVALIILAISGMFILKGKNGLKWRGTILISLGVILPLIFLALFYF